MVSVTLDRGGRVLTILIPAGMNAMMLQSGMNDYGLPTVIRLHVGDVTMIQNNDVAPRAILYAFVLPGHTDRRTITKVGSEMYSAGRGATASSSGFTSIFTTGW